MLRRVFADLILKRQKLKVLGNEKNLRLTTANIPRRKHYK